MKRIYLVLLMSISFGILHAELPNSIWGVAFGDTYEKVEGMITNDSTYYKIISKLDDEISFHYYKYKEWDFFGEKYNYMQILFNKYGRVYSIILTPDNNLYNVFEWVERTKETWEKVKKSYPDYKYDEETSKFYCEAFNSPYCWAIKNNEGTRGIVVAGKPIDEDKGFTSIVFYRYR